LPVLLASFSHLIEDRTRYLLKGDIKNPAESIFKVIQMLSSAGATVIGIPCNTAHADQIFSRIQDKVAAAGLDIHLLHMIKEVCGHISREYPADTPVGVLSTLGTYKTGLYKKLMKKQGIDIIPYDEALATRVHSAIYDTKIGIKSKSNPVSEQARRIVREAVASLKDQGAATVVLGCTELPLAVPEPVLNGVRLIDPSALLARALIREVAPEKLKPF